MLIGEINIEKNQVAVLQKQIYADPNKGQGVYFTTDGKAYIIGIIDPLTAFNCQKKAEYNFKKLKHGVEMSCVPPPMYS